MFYSKYHDLRNIDTLGTIYISSPLDVKHWLNERYGEEPEEFVGPPFKYVDGEALNIGYEVVGKISALELQYRRLK